MLLIKLKYNKVNRREIYMHWKLDLHQKYKNTKNIIQAPEMTNSISRLTTFIDQISHTVIVKKEDQQIEIDILSIIYIENIERITFVYTQSDIYEVGRPLYEVEEDLEKFKFIRINRMNFIIAKTSNNGTAYS